MPFITGSADNSLSLAGPYYYRQTVISSSSSLFSKSGLFFGSSLSIVGKQVETSTILANHESAIFKDTDGIHKKTAL